MKKYTRYSFYTLLFIMIGAISSCKNKNFTEHIGPSICASDNFQYVQQFTINTTNVNNVNLKLAPINFTAKFNEDVPWTILITGTTSKSFKKITGYGNSINANWAGNPDTSVFFLAEQCKVTFQVACKDAVIQYLTIGTVNGFSNFNYLVYDGDGNGVNDLSTGYYGTYATQVTTSGLNSPQGGNCFCTHGLSPTPQWFFGGYDMAVAPGNSINSDPTQVYFNCFVNVQGSTLTIPSLTLKEGAASRGKNLLVYGNGWHYVSIKLSDLGVINPRNITFVTFGLGGFPNQYTHGDMCIDFVTFTNDAPFFATAQ